MFVRAESVRVLVSCAQIGTRIGTRALAAPGSAAPRGTLGGMASRPKPVSNQPARPPPAEAQSSSAGRGGTREAIREIVRRYRETFERLGR